MKPDDLDALLLKASPEKLAAAHRKMGSRIRLWLSLMLVCLAAGIWIDWRWLPTMVIPLTVACYYGYLAQLFWKALKIKLTEPKNS